MSERIFLIHWNQTEADKHAAGLRASGWQVAVEAEDGARAAQSILANPPAVVIVYLTRLPSHGRHTAAYLRTRKGGKSIPLVFVGGKPAVVEKTKQQVPDGIYLEEHALPHVLEALLNPS